MSGRRWGGIGLLAIAAFMFLGFLNSSASLGSLTGIVALLLTVGLPAGAGIALLRGIGGARNARAERLRQQTIDAEVLRLAIQHAGKLTAVEVATALALSPETAKASLDSLAERSEEHTSELQSQSNLVCRLLLEKKKKKKKTVQPTTESKPRDK